jgi:hypothetical protein
VAVDFDLEERNNLQARAHSIPMQSDSLNIRLVGSWPSGSSSSVALDGDRKIAFVGTSIGEVYILDVMDVENPVLLSEVPISGNRPIDDLFYLDDYLYVVEYWDEVSIVSVADPSNPQVEGEWYPGGALSIAVEDTIAFVGYDVTGGSGGLEIRSIANPSNVQFISDLSGLGTAWQVLIDDTLAYIAAEGFGLQIVSISNPSNPYEVGQYFTTSGIARGVALCDTIAYIAAGDIHAVSVADPASPVEISSYTTPGLPISIECDNSIAYLADGNGGFRIISISDPANLHELGYYQTLGLAEDIAYSEPYSYVVTWEEGLLIFQYYDPTSINNREDKDTSIPKFFTLSQNYPNPFNPSTNIDFTIPTCSTRRVQLLIYDIRGRMVRELLDEEKEPGRYSVWWDGRDEKGMEVGSGVYLYRLVVGDLFWPFWSWSLYRS